MQIITLENKLVNLEINPALHYGLLLSGGIDSATMLYLTLLKYKEKSITPKIQPFTIDKSDGSVTHANNIISFINDKLTLSIPKTIIVGDASAHHTLQTRTAFKEIIEKHKYIDFTVISINQNPPNSNLFPGLAPVRMQQSPTPLLLAPFINLTKDEIIELIYRYDILELIDITHTCTKCAHGRCNKCWQCSERIWAFNKLGKTDTGTN